jgi:transposase
MTVRGFYPETGQEIEMTKLSNETDSLDQYFSSLEGPLCEVMESGTNSWSVYRILETHFDKLYVVDPTEVWGKVIKRGAKTDRRDAMKLAMKMYRSELNPLYIPDVRTQDLRMLTRGKINITRHITKTVNEIGALLRSWGIVLECSLLPKQGESVLKECRHRLPEYSLKVLDCQLGVLKELQEAESALEEDIRIAAEKDDVCRILTSIPGVG